MNILETGIPDVTKNNIQNTKLFLADKVISNVQPLLDNEYIDRVKKLKKLKKNIVDKRSKVIEGKNVLSKDLETLGRKKKENLLLTRISKLVSTGLLSKDQNLKSEMVFLIKVIDNIPDTKLNQYLEETMKIITKRLSKPLETN